MKTLLEYFADEILKPIAVFLYHMVCAVSILWVKVIFTALVLGIVLWVFSLKNEAKDSDTGKKYPLWRDLRLWAALVLTLQAAGYLILG